MNKGFIWRITIGHWKSYLPHWDDLRIFGEACMNWKWVGVTGKRIAELPLRSPAAFISAPVALYISSVVKLYFFFCGYWSCGSVIKILSKGLNILLQAKQHSAVSTINTLAVCCTVHIVSCLHPSLLWCLLDAVWALHICERKSVAEENCFQSWLCAQHECRGKNKLSSGVRAADAATRGTDDTRGPANSSVFETGKHKRNTMLFCKPSEKS